MNDKQIIVDINPCLKASIKELSKEFNVSLKYLIRIALIDLLKKHNKNIPVDEL